ncbi:MAG: hypothetical protein AAB570_00915 [Patescibacteria group bacterium]
MERRTVLIAACVFLGMVKWCYSKAQVESENEALPQPEHSSQLEESRVGHALLSSGLDPQILRWAPTLERQYTWVLYQYPIETLRGRLHDFVEASEGTLPPVRAVFDMGVEYDPSAHILAKAFFTPAGHPAMEINVIPLYHHWMEMKHVDGAFADFLMIVMLHEQYHLEEQEVDSDEGSENMTPDEYAALEMAAYLDTALIIKTMRDEGRAPVEAYSPFAQALWAYVVGGEDLTHPIWVQFGRLVTNRDNEFADVLSAWQGRNHEE